MNKKILITTASVAITSVVLAVFFNSSNDSAYENEKQTTTQENQRFSSTTSKLHRPSDAIKNATNDTYQVATGQNSAIDSQGHLEHETKVKSVELFNQQFLSIDRENESLYQSSLEEVFKTPTDEVIADMQLVEYSELAQQRKNKIADYIQNKLSDLNIIEEKFECAGRVCLVDIKFSNEDSNGALNTFYEFDVNYSFENKTTDDAGTTTYKALFIETKDASKLSMINTPPSI